MKTQSTKEQKKEMAARRKLTKLLKSNEEIVCINEGAYVAATVLMLELLHAHPLDIKLAKLVKAY